MNLGFDQLNIPAPLFYRRACNAYIIIIAPALAGFVASLPLGQDWKLVMTGGLILFGALVKALEYVIGETPPPPIIDNSNTPK